MYQMQALNIRGLPWLTALSKHSAPQNRNYAGSSSWGSEESYGRDTGR